jgi:hypothetical protein
MVELCMDACLQARVDASDVLQDAFLDATARLDDYARQECDRAGVIPAAADGPMLVPEPLKLRASIGSTEAT